MVSLMSFKLSFSGTREQQRCEVEKRFSFPGHSRIFNEEHNPLTGSFAKGLGSGKVREYGYRRNRPHGAGQVNQMNVVTNSHPGQGADPERFGFIYERIGRPEAQRLKIFFGPRQGVDEEQGFITTIVDLRQNGKVKNAGIRHQPAQTCGRGQGNRIFPAAFF